jgi:hypothetical protein
MSNSSDGRFWNDGFSQPGYNHRAFDQEPGQALLGLLTLASRARNRKFLAIVRILRC